MREKLVFASSSTRVAPVLNGSWARYHCPVSTPLNPATDCSQHPDNSSFLIILVPRVLGNRKSSRNTRRAGGILALNSDRMRSCHGYAIDRKADGIYAARSMVAHRKEEVAVAGRWAQGDERMEIGNDSIAVTLLNLISGINAYALKEISRPCCSVRPQGSRAEVAFFPSRQSVQP